MTENKIQRRIESRRSEGLMIMFVGLVFAIIGMLGTYGLAGAFLSEHYMAPIMVGAVAAFYGWLKVMV